MGGARFDARRPPAVLQAGAFGFQLTSGYRVGIFLLQRLWDETGNASDSEFVATALGFALNADAGSFKL